MSDSRQNGPSPDQPTLDGLNVAKPPAARLERAVRDATDAAGFLAIDGAAAELAAALGQAVDIGLRRLDPYAAATAGRELREVLARLKMDPTARDAAAGTGDPWTLLEKSLQDAAPHVAVDA